MNPSEIELIPGEFKLIRLDADTQNVIKSNTTTTHVVRLHTHASHLGGVNN